MARELLMERKMLYEMAHFDLAEEVCRVITGKHRRRNIIMAYVMAGDMEEDRDEEDCLLLFLTSILKEVETCDEQQVSLAVKSILERVLSSPLSILRPYQQLHRTSGGVNRVTLANFKSKFAGLFEVYFRFKEQDIVNLQEMLKIPMCVCFNGYRAGGLECLLIMLYRLVTGCRLIDMSVMFDLLPQTLSHLINGLVLYLYKLWGNHVRSLRHDWASSRTSLDEYSQATGQKGIPLGDTVSFVDGTTIEVARPVRGQRSWYNGHIKSHCFKSIALQYPNGLINAFGPFNGADHDSTCSEQIQLDNRLTEIYTFPDRVFRAYGDAGFGIGSSIITPFRTRANQPREERRWNLEMSRSRISSEWGFGIVKNKFKLLTRKSSMRALSSPVACYFFVCVHLANLHTCLYGSQVTNYFQMNNPTVDDYLS